MTTKTMSFCKSLRLLASMMEGLKIRAHVQGSTTQPQVSETNIIILFVCLFLYIYIYILGSHLFQLLLKALSTVAVIQFNSLPHKQYIANLLLIRCYCFFSLRTALKWRSNLQAVNAPSHFILLFLPIKLLNVVFVIYSFETLSTRSVT